MGKVATHHFASRGAEVIMAVRNTAKAEAIRQEIIKEFPYAIIKVRQVDMSSMASVRAFVAGLEDEYQKGQITHLFNNAGVIARGYVQTEEGFESTIATNYLGPCLLTLLAIEKLGVKNICSMVSLTTRYGSIDEDFFTDSSFPSRLKVYSNSKLALLHFSAQLALRYPELKINVADPGIVNTNMISMGKWFDPLADIFFRPFISTPQKGVEPALRALRSSERLHYFVGKRTKNISPKIIYSPKGTWLWRQTIKIIYQHTPEGDLKKLRELSSNASKKGGL